MFLAVATSLFALFISAYAMRMHFGDWKPLPEPRLLWWNSGVLVVTSIAMQATVSAARRGDRVALRKRLLVGGVLTCVVPDRPVDRVAAAQRRRLLPRQQSGQRLLLPADRGRMRCTCSADWWRGGAPSLRLGRGEDVAALRLGVELCATYWHFLLIVWFVLFGLLLMT